MAGPVRLPTDALEPADLRGLRALLDRSFADRAGGGDFSDDDWAHALGGEHVLVREGGAIVAHGSVVPRSIRVGGRDLAAGYVEAVATAPERRGRGHGTVVMRAIGEIVAERYELGVLSTSRAAFYLRLGWERWLGPSFVLRGGIPERTPDEDDGLLVLRTPRTGSFDLTAAIACEERPGDDW